MFFSSEYFQEIHFKLSKKALLAELGGFRPCKLLYSDIIFISDIEDIEDIEDLQCLNVKPRPNDRNMPTQHVATLLGATCCVRLATVLRHVGCCGLKFDLFQISANNTQHVATRRRNRVAKRTQHVAPDNVVICCVGMLQSFRQGLTFKGSF